MGTRKRIKSPPKRGRAKIKASKSPRTITPLKTLIGTLTVHKDGYGFVMVENSEEPDVFIPPRRMEGAWGGDKVRVSAWSRGRDTRQEGRVEEILERGKRWLVGRLHKEGKQYLVSCEVGPEHPDFVVDREDLIGARLEETVGIEVLDYPKGEQPGRAKVIQLFGARGDEATEIDIVILKHQLATEFSAPVLQEAELISKNRVIELSPGRRDLRELPFVTVDGETARDFDDAICVQKEERGFRLWVSIADVSHYVKEGSPLDKEAFKRGTSVYFTQKVLPMLPEAISNDLCSLRPREDRFSFTAELFFDETGKFQESQFYKSLICSHARLTYRQVAAALLDEDPKAQKKIKDSLPMLQVAYELFLVLRKQRIARGSIDFDLPEAEVLMDLEEGDIETIIKAERNEAHMLIEDFMIAANEAVASFITEQKRPSLFRVHGQPDPEKIKNFEILLHNLGFKVHFPPNPQPKDLAKVLPLFQGHPEKKLIQHLLLRSMKQAVYSAKNEGHFGLASPCYTHFTSPIRRYPDLTIHRILNRVLEGGRLSEGGKKADLVKLTSIGSHTSRRERIAMEAEWEALDLMAALFMKKFIGESFDGIVSRVNKYGLVVELLTYFVEGFIGMEDLSSDDFVYDEKHLRLTGRRTRKTFKIGSEVRVTVAKVDVEARKVHFLME